MRERDAALDKAIPEVAAILGDALVRLIFPAPLVRQVDFPKTEIRVREEIEGLRNQAEILPPPRD
jgi:hypothetical protein